MNTAPAARPLALAALLATAGTLAAPRPARAAFLLFNWSGTSGVDNAWYRPGNWFQNAAPPTSPGPGDTVNLYFDNTSAPFPSVQPDYTISTINLTATSTSYTFDTGTLTINGGLAMGANAAAQTFGNPLVLGASQTWRLNGGAGLLSCPGGVDLGAHTLTVNAVSNRTLGGSFSGAGGNFTKVGSADLTLVDGFKGTMPLGNVNEGTLTLNAGAAFNGTNLTVASGAGLTVAGSVNGSGQYLNVNGSATLPTGGKMAVSTIGLFNGSFTQTGGTNSVVNSLYFQGSGTGRSTYGLTGSDAQLTTLVTTLLSGTTAFSQGGGTHTTGGLNLDGASASYTLANSAVLTVRNPDPQSTDVPTTVVGSGGAGTFTHTGGTHTTGLLVLADDAGSTGTYTLSGAASRLFTGSTVVGRGGAGTFTQSNGTHKVSGDLLVAGTVGGRGTYTLSGGSLSTTNTQVGYQGTGTFTQSGGTHDVATQLQVANGGTYTLNGGTVRAPLVSVVGNGPVFNLNGGTLQTGTVSLGGTNNTFNFAGGTLQATADNSTFVRFPGDVRVGGNGGAVIDTNGHNVTVPVILAHDPALGATADGGLLKLGAGTLTLTGAGASGETTGSTYTGGTRVNAGTLLVNANANNPAATVSATGTGPVTVNAGGTLGGDGVIAGPVTVNGGGTLAPGNSPGRLTLGGSLTLAAGSTLAVELGGTTAGSYDQVFLAGPLTLGGNLDVTLVNGFTPALNQTFTILDDTGNGLPATPGFANAPGGLYNDGAGHLFLVNYAANADGGVVPNDVTLTVVPEPGTGALTALGATLGALGLARRRRRFRAV